MFGDFIKRKRYQNFGSEIKLGQFADDTNLFCADVAVLLNKPWEQ